eukprot:9484102-Pyramimonas_sp.AAC.1
MLFDLSLALDGEIPKPVLEDPASPLNNDSTTSRGGPRPPQEDSRTATRPDQTAPEWLHRSALGELNRVESWRPRRPRAPRRPPTSPPSAITA